MGGERNGEGREGVRDMLAGVLETLTNRDLHVAEQGQTFVQVFGATHFASLLRGTKFGALVFQDSRSL